MLYHYFSILRSKWSCGTNASKSTMITSPRLSFLHCSITTPRFLILYRKQERLYSFFDRLKAQQVQDLLCFLILYSKEFYSEEFSPRDIDLLFLPRLCFLNLTPNHHIFCCMVFLMLYIYSSQQDREETALDGCQSFFSLR